MARPTNSELQQAEALHSEGFRLCRTCNYQLPLNAFGACKQTKHGLQMSCKRCTNTRQREKYQPNLSDEARQRKLDKMRDDRKSNPDKWIKYSNDSNARRYGFDNYEEYREFLSRGCDICNEPATQVDHCHKTGKTRGALCHNCNSMLGMAKDSAWRLTKGIEYLTRYEEFV